MIAAHELRIGNWVLARPEIAGIETESEELVNIQVAFVSKNMAHEEWLYPIPLTPEILEKCGFEKHHSNYYVDALMLKPNGNVWEVWLYPAPSPQSAYNATNIRFIHELQNLYFALTGEELEVNL